MSGEKNHWKAYSNYWVWDYNWRWSEKLERKNKCRKANKIASKEDMDSFSIEDSDEELSNNQQNKVTSLQQKLRNEVLECLICFVKLKYDDKIWSCTRCYLMYHLRCMTVWIDNELKSLKPETFRCPQCQFNYQFTDVKSKKKQKDWRLNYTCFCGQVESPKPWKRNPHSCGKICGKNLELCKIHTCQLQCHPGPCGACPLKGPIVSCYCGAEQRQNPCEDMTQFSCEKTICGKIIPTCRSLAHYCKRICHAEDCGDCTELVSVVECFCKKTKRTNVPCQGPSSHKSFSCGGTCEKILECGNHYCQHECHEGVCLPCKYDIDTWITCACGKSLQTELRGQKRLSCTDPFFTCENTCGNLGLCDHPCEAKCHNGECPPCSKKMDVNCQCGRTKKSVLCFESRIEIRCHSVCGEFLNCARHVCKIKCCSYIRQMKTTVDRPHVCMQVCGKLLNCGKHKCKSFCHMGNCKPCEEIRNEPESCACGSQIIYPPIKCAQEPPVCQEQCKKKCKSCGARCEDNCHFGDCSPCVNLVPKHCLGGHEVIYNLICSQPAPSCSQACGRRKPKCFSQAHVCKARCHSFVSCKAGPCTEKCLKKREFCFHTCQSICHPDACPDTKCQVKIRVKCPCNLLETVTQCNADSSNPFPDILKPQCSLKCKERKRKMNEKLEVDNVLSHDTHNVKYNKDFLEFLQDHENLEFFLKSEKILRDIVICKKQDKDGKSSWRLLPSPNKKQHEYLLYFAIQLYQVHVARVFSITNNNQPDLAAAYVPHNSTICHPTVQDALNNSNLIQKLSPYRVVIQEMYRPRADNAYRLREIQKVDDKLYWPYALRFRVVSELCKAENQGRRLCRGDFCIDFFDEDILSLEPSDNITDNCSAIIQFIDFQAAFIGHGKLENMTNIKGVVFEKNPRTEGT